MDYKAEIKGIFVARYKDSLIAYFNYNGDQEGLTIKNYITHEYEKILREVFEFTAEEIATIFNRIYFDTFRKGDD